MSQVATSPRRVLLTSEEMAEYAEPVVLSQESIERGEFYVHVVTRVLSAPDKTIVGSWALDVAQSCAFKRHGDFIEMGCPHAVTYWVRIEMDNGDFLCEKVWETSDV